jgi:lipopolysaccharide transport system permease protein
LNQRLADVKNGAWSCYRPRPLRYRIMANDLSDPRAKTGAEGSPSDPPGTAAAARPESSQQRYFGHDHVTVIAPPGRFEFMDVRELWAYRELLGTLARRQISVRYKQTILGGGWAIVQPLLQMVVFTVLFGRMAKIPSEGVPYPIFVYSALLPWTYFTNATTSAITSTVANSHLISKVYFPRLIIPLASTIAALVDFLVATSVLVGLMLWYGIPLSLQLMVAPALVFGLVLAATGIGAGLGALNVSYRDLGHVMPFVMQLWLYATPVVYPAGAVPDSLRLVLKLNPLTGLIAGFRSAVLGHPLDTGAIVFSLGIALLLFIGGTLYFHAVERRFADVV